MTKKDKHLVSLCVATFAIVVAWQFPFGHIIMWPFTYLATWYHEMGHGLMAMLLGGSFHKLVIDSTGSGYAQYSGVAFGAIGKTLVSAAGLIGPAIVGSIMILAGSNEKRAHLVLKGLVAFLAISLIVWVRSFVGVCVMVVFICALGIALKIFSKGLLILITQSLGLLAFASLYMNIGYLFTATAHSGPSDTANMMIFPYFIWGVIIILADGVLLFLTLQAVLNQDDKASVLKRK